jgi:hypothetical protein
MPLSKQPQPAISTMGITTSQRIRDSQTFRVLTWVLAVGSVFTQVVSVLAGSADEWFAWLVASLGLFGCLTLSRNLLKQNRRVSEVPKPAVPEVPQVHEVHEVHEIPMLSGTPKARIVPRIDRGWNLFTLAAMILVLLAGLVKPPHRSNDVYAYGAYGRLVSEHSVSPYVTRPSAFVTDPVITRMTPGWRNTRSVYGPAFTAISAAGMRVAGTSLLIERIWFQTLAALATALSALILKRLSPQHWWMFALNPVALIVVAHEGHNDALVGLGILSALWFARKVEAATPNGPQFPWFAHAAIGSLVFAASIKITAILAAPALAMWIYRHFGLKHAARIGAPWIAVCTGLFAAVGGPAALGAFRGLRAFRSTTSLWHLEVIRQLTDGAGRKPGALALTLPAVALAISGLFVILQTLRPALPQPQTDSWQAEQRSQPHSTMHAYEFVQLAFLATAPLIVFISLGLYVLPWYWAWLLPPAILLPSKLRLVVLMCAATHAVAYGAGTRLHGALATVLKLGRFSSPLAFVVAISFVILGLVCRRPFLPKTTPLPAQP